MKRFEKVVPVDGHEILTPDGFKPLAKLMLTEPFAEYKLTTVGGKTLNCADKHIVITEDDREEFVDELFVGQRVQTADGVDIVESVNSTGNTHRMYDVEVPDGHVYYADDILSHNTTTSMAYLLHQAITRSNITIAILANKGDTAAEVLDRIKFAYESLPWFLQVGVKTWNRRSVEFGNGTKIITAATSGSSIRGKSVNCVSGDTAITVEHDGSVFDITMHELYANADKYGLTPYQNFETGSDFHVENISEIVANKHLFDTSSKYFRIYMNIILRAKQRPIDGYRVLHHILPKPMGGSNDKYNLVYLTSREYSLVNKILPKIVRVEQ